METPDSSRSRNTIVQMLAAAGRSVPVVGVGVDVIMGAVSAAQRERDEEFFAHVAASSKLTAERVDAIAAGEEPEFVATAHRVVREAQATADETRREMLARVLANSGSWSPFPPDDREEMASIVISLTSRQVAVLHFLSDPRAWVERHPDRPWPTGLAPQTYRQALTYFLADLHDAKEHERLFEAAEGLERRGLISRLALDTNLAHLGDGIVAVSKLGVKVISYLSD